MKRRERYGIRDAALALLAGTLAACTTGTGLASGSRAGSAAGEPDEAAMREAIQQYLLSRDVRNAADRPRYLNATRSHRFAQIEGRWVSRGPVRLRRRTAPRAARPS
jgi:hypothetical protein